MKRVIAILLIVIVLALSACQSETKPNISSGDVYEQSFQLESGDYSLNAVYTYSGSKGPAVLLIAGSGPSDENETVGALKPFADIADGLAEHGVSSLRVEKRTYRYGNSLEPTAGIEEEYLSDCRTAIKWLKEQEGVESIYLLGHSLGGQIAAALASEEIGIDGIILWNSTARHLADIARDQYVAADPKNTSAYDGLATDAKAATYTTARDDYYYYGANEFYWASYNELNVIEDIVSSNIPTLIINSTYDNQLFDADIQLWQDSLGNASNVMIKLYDDQSHFGYRIDTNSSGALFSEQEFPNELIEDFVGFCK